MTEKTKAEIKKKFDGFDYPINIVGRHLDVTEAMKSYALEKLSKVDKLAGHVISATVVMDIQKQIHCIDFLLDVNNTLIKVSAHTRDMYASIDQAIDRLKLKVKKYMARLHDHHARDVQAIDVNVQVVQRDATDEINDAIEEANLEKIEASLRPGSVIASEKRPLKTLTTEEAIMKMDLSESSFLVYRSESDRKLKVIHRRDDHRHYGIIELPE
ncbi:MAG: ribosome-associated translation inhibitor RaiA [Verrucomicrobia bacterium]|nr:ribosome-associated translation inhibitor RaiA [Verrucomicrobiota bacterium]MBS0646173.1 ribosome-associated translation inhibitor RaiA [Verrucomicrobiota bacterium]